jgi:hypothetical protein
MPEKRSHVKLDTKRQIEKVEVFKYNYGYSKSEEASDEREVVEQDYQALAESFIVDLATWESDVNIRTANRNPVLKVPVNYEYVEIIFQGQFTISTYYQKWYNEFGLEAVEIYNYGTTLLFAVINQGKFTSFLTSINNFIKSETEQDNSKIYNGLIKYVQSFKLLKSSDITQLENVEPLVNFRLIDLTLQPKQRKLLLDSLLFRLEELNLEYNLDEGVSNLEVVNLTNDQLVEIVNNYDLILSVTSSLATTISPSEYNLPERSYGFTISNSDDDLPIIGIIDSGISYMTPLAPILILDEDLNTTRTSVGEDNINMGQGHGTGVAALAALGKKPYSQGYSNEIAADARLLSIKIIDETSNYLSQNQIIEKLHLAKARYPEVKVFTLTINYQNHKKFNEAHSSYSYALDLFAHEHDCLICICTANNDDAGLHNTSYDEQYFSLESTNICVPAESMNNITVGAASHSLREGNHLGISLGKEYPTLYSRRSHLDFSKLPAKAKTNNHLFKPDLIECGGDYAYSRTGMIIDESDARMDILSARASESFYKALGTSYSTPLIANTAINILRQYPSLKAATIKALILNSASNQNIKFNNAKILNTIAGHGFSNEERATFSNPNEITLIIEESIDSEEMKIIPLFFPKYLVEQDLGKVNGIVQLTATLCFSFKPILNNQQGYCPVHIAFGIFKNQTGEDILKSETEVHSKIKSNGKLWSQNAREVSKPIPYSNVQKLTFPINVNELLNEENTFKLAIHCVLNRQLLQGQQDAYITGNDFSIALTLTETLRQDKQTGMLYDQVIANNTVLNIANIDAEGDLTLEN